MSDDPTLLTPEEEAELRAIEPRYWELVDKRQNRERRRREEIEEELSRAEEAEEAAKAEKARLLMSPIDPSEPYTEDDIRDVLAYRYGIRVATRSELNRMTPEQRWNYEALAYRRLGCHRDFFGFEGRAVKNVGLDFTGALFLYPSAESIDKAFATAWLRPWPIHMKNHFETET